MNRYRPLVLAAVAALCLLASPTLAQQQGLSSDIRTAGSSLSAPQQQALTVYVNFWVNQLTNGTANQISEARTKLLEPTAPGGSQIFYSAYASTVTGELASAIGNDRSVVRINAMIVASELRDPEVIDLIENGLQDPSPGVRYWAAKTAASLPGSEGLDQSQQARLIALLQPALASGNASAPVVEQMLVALVSMDHPEALPLALQVLNARISSHANAPEQGLEPDLQALKRIFVKVIQADASNKPLSQQVIRDLALVSFRSMELSAKLLDSGAVARSTANTADRLLELGDKTLRWAVGKLAPQASLPADIEEIRRNGNWAMILLNNSDQWKPILQQSPFGFNPAALSVPLNL